MASVRRRQKIEGSRSLRSNPRSKATKIFKIILNPRAHMLRIPSDFTRKYGSYMPNRVIIKVSGGPEFRSELIQFEGQTWLNNGWQEFREHYSIGFGKFLVFEYDMKSCFYVRIFDMNGEEIENPSNVNVHDRTTNKNIRRERKLPKLKNIGSESESESDDDSDYVFSETDQDMDSPEKKRKRGRTDHGLLPMRKIVLGLQARSVVQRDSRFKTSSQNSEQYENFQSLKPDRTTPKLDSPSLESSEVKECNGEDIRRELGNGPVDRETSTAYQRAKAFKSDNPSHNSFFISLMQPDYITNAYPKLAVPISIAPKRLLPGRSEKVKLCLSDGKTWDVICSMGLGNASLTYGWKTFVMDNGLKVGDACIFEINNTNKLLWNITIFRD